MVETNLPRSPSRKQKQPISVPFTWETTPGTPRNDWKPVRPSRPPPTPPTLPPIKLIASVPFEWEEKPGTPLPSFSQPTTGFGGNKGEKNIGNKDEMEMIFGSFNFPTDESYNSVPSQLANGLLPPPPRHLIKLSTSIPFEWEEKPRKALPSYPLQPKNFENRTRNEREMIFESDFETFSFKTDEPFSCMPLRQANRFEPPPPHPPIKLSASIPFEWDVKPGKPLPSFPFSTPVYSQYVDGDENGSEYEREMISESDSETLSFHTNESYNSVPSLLANCLVPAVTIANAIPVSETPPSPPGYESDSSTSSYATGTTSLVGAPFLARLFPLISPKLSFPEKVMCPEEKINSSKDHKTKIQSKDSDCESSFSATVRRPTTTLGELIIMSRRQSYTRKAVQIRTHNSMGSMKKGATGCFLSGINNRIDGLQRKIKRQLQLKLI